MLKSDETAFYKALWDDNANEFSWVSSDYARERIAIYRNTVVQNLTQALAITYPGIWKLLGEDCANQVARFYIKKTENLPRTGCLDDWGDGFIAHLSTQPQLGELLYLTDYACYEWLKHLSFCAPDIPSLAPDAIAALITCTEDPQFEFHPSVYLIASDYRLDQIEAVLQEPQSKIYALENTGCYGIIMRTDSEINTLWVEKESWHYIRGLMNRSLNEKDYQRMIDNEVAKKNAEILSLIFRLGGIVNIDK